MPRKIIINTLDQNQKNNLHSRFKSIGFIVIFAIMLLAIGMLSDARHNNKWSSSYGIVSNGINGFGFFLPRYVNFSFAILFVFTTIWLVWFLSIEINNCYTKWENKKFLKYFAILLTPLIVETSLILYIVYWANSHVLAKICGIIFFGVILITIISYLFIFTQISKKNKFDRKNFWLLFATNILVLFLFIGVYYLTLVRGVLTVVFVIFICIGVDGGGYVFGIFFGKHKFAPKISPKKTWEGVGGGIFCSIVVCILIMLFYNYVLQHDTMQNILGNQWHWDLPRNALIEPNKPLWWLILILLLFIFSILSILGDLFFSIGKRKNGIKDYSNYIKGHGGLLDRMDSWAVVIACWCLLTIFISAISTLAEGITPDNDRIFNVVYIG